MNNLAYPGQGRILYLATYSGSAPALLTYPLNPIIGTGEFSDLEPLNDAVKAALTITYNVVPTAVTTIEYDTDPWFANAIILATLPASATDKVAVWTSTEPLPGFIRVNNTSNVQINQTTVQKFFY